MNEIIPYTLYIISTPIGNLEDITLRALNILKNVDIIACEDTRHSLKLLNHYEIKKHIITHHSYNEKKSCKGIIKLLKDGKSVALITDGGTPCISDPGFLLVKKCREIDINVSAIPGASAFLTLLASSGFRSDNFFFHGFLSTKEGRRKKELIRMSLIKATHIIYESPHRITKCIDNINEIFPEKLICIGKELTKNNEEIIIGDCNKIKNELIKKKIRGEYTILIANY